MKHLLILLSLLPLSSPLFGQSELPETIIIPVSSMGNVSDTRKIILQNTLSQELAKYFKIIPQNRFEKAQEQVFNELEYDECTEEQCIIRIQEILQSENLFHLEVIGEDVDTQLNLKWVNLDETRNIADYCENCKTKELRGKVVELAGKLVEIEKNEQYLVVNDRRKEGILFYREKNNKLGWFEDGDEVNDSKFVGEIKNELPNGKGSITSHDGTTYEGEFKDGNFHGQGIFTLPNGGKYVGGFKDGSQNGQGTYTVSNGSKYEGEWKDGKYHGQGTYTGSDGLKYVGEFKNGVLNGQGTQTSPNGGRYVGKFKDGQYWNGTFYDKKNKFFIKYIDGKLKFHDGNLNGQGTRIYPGGAKYVGEFKNGELNGQGTMTLPNGNKYVGGWKDGKSDGHGIYTWSDGTKYKGEFKDGYRNGLGVITYTFKGSLEEMKTGTKYIGGWKDGNKHGQGIQTYKDGDFYEGDFRDGQYHGQGKKTFGIGTKYEGEYRDGKRNGQGTIIFPNGTKYIGKWKDNERWNGIEYSKKGKIIGKWLNGVKQ